MVLLFLKIFINLPRAYERLHYKVESIGSAFSETMRYRQPDILLLLYVRILKFSNNHKKKFFNGYLYIPKFFFTWLESKVKLLIFRYNAQERPPTQG